MNKTNSITQIDIEMTCLAGCLKYVVAGPDDLSELGLSQEDIERLKQLADVSGKNITEDTEDNFRIQLADYIRSIIQRSKELV